MRSLAFSRRDETWVVRGEERRSGAGGELVLAHDELEALSAADLRMALSTNAQYYGYSYAEGLVSLLPEAHLDTDAGGGPIGFECRNGVLLLTVLHFTGWPEDGVEETQLAKLTKLVQPYLNHRRAKLAAINVEDSWSGALDMAVCIRLELPWRGRTVRDLFEVGDATLKLCDAFSSSEITRSSVADLVRGGCSDLLVGQPEGNWLDAKAQEYDLTNTRGKVSLAQAVARFCNGDEGGLIVVGAHAKRIPGGEEIRQVPGVVPRHSDTEARYRRILDQHLYPPVMGLRIDIVPTSGDRVLISIDIPPQPEELKPFLVHGAITADGDTEGSFISIVQRRGEGSIPTTAPMIHASLAAGRALLRGNRPPRGQGSTATNDKLSSYARIAAVRRRLFSRVGADADVDVWAGSLGRSSGRGACSRRWHRRGRASRVGNTQSWVNMMRF